ncbi:hypothetical protein [Mycobacterium haemophilum]|nr:hypothetical protein [Mycobacterium haemophilum]MCV7341449.1 hypothetical protein [Mycobacterium haemophilum DSM 44634]
MTSAGTSKRARTPVPPELVVIGNHRQAIALMVDDGQTARSVAVFAVP